MKSRFNRYNSRIIWIITVILVIITTLFILYFISYTNRISETSESESLERYYAIITDDPDASFWQSVHKSASEAAAEQNAYVEMISNNLSQEYDIYELMEIAIASKVSGIIVSADESEEMSALINEASEAGIPVVTLYSDNTNSDRLSYVGVSNYNLGKIYGSLILEIAGSKSFDSDKIKAVVLTDASGTDSGQGMLYSAILESVENESTPNKVGHPPIEVSMYPVDSTNSFSVEESVRALFMRGKAEIPDIVVCLNDIDTTSVYQAVVDYNEVGDTDILGYYDSEAILKGIERNVIYATLAIDTNQMGQFCIDALSEYFEYGYTSQYFTTDISLINKQNVSEYMEGTDDEN